MTNLESNTTYDSLVLQVTYDGLSGDTQVVESNIESFTTNSIENVGSVEIISTNIDEQNITKNSATVDYVLDLEKENEDNPGQEVTSPAQVDNVLIINSSLNSDEEGYILAIDPDPDLVKNENGYYDGQITINNLKPNTNYDNLQLVVQYNGDTQWDSTETNSKDFSIETKFNFIPIIILMLLTLILILILISVINNNSIKKKKQFK